MIGSLYAAFRGNKAAFESNETAREALRKVYIPWLKVGDIKVIPIKEKRFQIEFVLKNFSPAPALRFSIATTKPISQVVRQHWGNEVIMPEASRRFTVTYSGPHVDEKLKKVQIGEEPIRFTIEFCDIFKRKYAVEHEFRWDVEENDWLSTDYTIDGID